MALQVISILVSVLALTISFLTAWFSLFYRGTIKMTQPTTIFFGPDGSSGPPKIFLRTLLFSTAKKGQIVENMYVELQQDGNRRNFNIWVYDEKDHLARGSGLFVSMEGIVCNHHFLLPKNSAAFEFLPGESILTVFASLLGKRHPILLFTQKLDLTFEFASEVNNKSGVYFDWEPDSKIYRSHLDKKPNRSDIMWA
jgi:hypothetical protein